MSFAERSAQGRFEDKFNNQIQRSISDLQETRAKKMQLDESSHVAQVLRGIASKGNDASYGDIVGEIFGKGLSPQSEQALLENISKYSPKFQENRLAQQKQGQSDKILGQVFGDGGKINNERNQSESPQGSTSQGNYPVQEETNPQLGSQQQGNEKLNITPQMILAANRVDPSLGNALQKQYDSQQKIDLQNRKEQFSREKSSETELLKISDHLSQLKNEKMHFDRLENLFSPQLESKFPPAVLVSAFTKNGELSAFGQSQLSPEAQEAVKLVTDQIKGAKDTFGSRVTNFDAQTYLKTLPNLLNSPEGRRRVLRDLKLINDINQMEAEGVLDIIDREGGQGNISLSKAKRIFAKEFEPKRKELAEEFVNPEKKEFNSPPNAANYTGKRLQDDQGKVFISNGKEWVPQEE